MCGRGVYMLIRDPEYLMFLLILRHVQSNETLEKRGGGEMEGEREGE